MRASEAALIGKTASREAFLVAAELALQGARPLSGNRYKVELLKQTIVRALEMAGEMA